MFQADRENKMAALTSDSPRHFRFHWNPWKEVNETWQEARSKSPVPSLCFRADWKKTRWSPWLLIGRDIFDFYSETAEENSTNLDRKQDLNVRLLPSLCFSVDQKNKMAALASDILDFSYERITARSHRPLPSLWPLIDLDIFDFSSETAEWNSTKLDRKQNLNGQSEKKDGCPSLSLAETFSTFPLKLLNRIQENLIGSKISRSYTKFLFFGLLSLQK